jgi:hypothetical protein
MIRKRRHKPLSGAMAERPVPVFEGSLTVIPYLTRPRRPMPNLSGWEWLDEGQTETKAAKAQKQALVAIAALLAGVILAIGALA